MARNDDLRLRALRALGDPGFFSPFSGLEMQHEQHDPAVGLMAALACDRIEEPIVEALPWLFLRYEHLDWTWLVAEARRRGVQNRLGFVVSLALRASASSLGMGWFTRLAAIEEELYACRNAREETRWLRVAPSRRSWLETRRSDEVAPWGVPLTLRPADLRFLNEA